MLLIIQNTFLIYSLNQQPVSFIVRGGSKAGPEILSRTISEARQIAIGCGAEPSYLPDPENLSDSAETALPENTTIIQSIDTLSQHISDPFLFGRIAALHAMSDIFVSGGTMLNAMAHMVAKRGSLALQQRDLTAMLAGAMVECATHNCTCLAGIVLPVKRPRSDLASQAQYQNR